MQKWRHTHKLAPRLNSMWLMPIGIHGFWTVLIEFSWFPVIYLDIHTEISLSINLFASEQHKFHHFADRYRYRRKRTERWSEKSVTDHLRLFLSPTISVWFVSCACTVLVYQLLVLYMSHNSISVLVSIFISILLCRKEFACFLSQEVQWKRLEVGEPSVNLICLHEPIT